MNEPYIICDTYGKVVGITPSHTLKHMNDPYITGLKQYWILPGGYSETRQSLSIPAYHRDDVDHLLQQLRELADKWEAFTWEPYRNPAIKLRAILNSAAGQL